MPNIPEPLIQLQPDGQAPIIEYDVPEPSVYTGRNYIGLLFDPAVFTTTANAPPPRDPSPGEDAVRTALTTGVFASKLFPNVSIRSNKLSFVDFTNNRLVDTSTASGAALTTGLAASGIPEQVSRVFSRLDPVAATQRIQAGERLNVFRNMYGSFQYNFLPQPVLVPRILLVESYELSTHLGSYGAGRTLSTFTLLPGEKTTISIKTYKKTETESKQASSILDSFTEESSSEFENSVQDEQSDKHDSSESFEYHAEADAHASWGWGSANISGGVKGGSNSSREEFAKNISSATDKHAAKASAKRDVHVDTSYSVKQETGVETSIERQLQNINVGRTLNFVFRQMNQEFYTVLSLIDVRVAFFNGYAESRRELPLPKLDDLLNDVVVPEQRNLVRAQIRDTLDNIVDYRDNLQSFVEEVTRFAGETPYLRIRKDLVSTFRNDATGFEVKVPGIPVTGTRNVMRTEGIIVEALLGQGEGLDVYSKGLQEQAVRAKTIENDAKQAALARETLAQSVIADGSSAKADLFAKLFPLPPVCCCHPPETSPAAPTPAP